MLREEEEMDKFIPSFGSNVSRCQRTKVVQFSNIRRSSSLLEKHPDKRSRDEKNKKGDVEKYADQIASMNAIEATKRVQMTQRSLQKIQQSTNGFPGLANAGARK